MLILIIKSNDSLMSLYHENHYRYPLRSPSPILPSAHQARPKVLVRVLLAFSALSAFALLLFGGHERAEKIAVYREPLGEVQKKVGVCFGRGGSNVVFGSSVGDINGQNW